MTVSRELLRFLRRVLGGNPKTVKEETKGGERTVERKEGRGFLEFCFETIQDCYVIETINYIFSKTRLPIIFTGQATICCGLAFFQRAAVSPVLFNRIPPDFLCSSFLVLTLPSRSFEASGSFLEESYANSAKKISQTYSKKVTSLVPINDQLPN